MSLKGIERSWLSVKNDVLIISDFILGVILLILLLKENPELITLSLIIIGLLIISYLYRSVEYFLHPTDQFCSNIPLFMVNNLKLAGLITIIFLR